jgi:hypothetical protein
MEVKSYTLIPCKDEWILLSSLEDYDRLHSLASIRAFRTRNDSWEVRPPSGSAFYLYAAESPLEAAHSYLSSMGIDGVVKVIN